MIHTVMISKQEKHKLIIPAPQGLAHSPEETKQCCRSGSPKAKDILKLESDKEETLSVDSETHTAHFICTRFTQIPQIL